MDTVLGTAFDAIKIPIEGGLSLLIADVKLSSPEEGLAEHHCLSAGWLGKESFSPRPPIVYNPDAPTSGLHKLTLFEIKRYFWCLSAPDNQPIPQHIRVRSSLDNKKAGWTQRTIGVGQLQGEFCVINYLGSAWIRVDGQDQPIEFDIITEKINFASEYRRMVEAIAESCQQLLLEWGSPTSFSFTPDSEREKQILLEQFLFLKNFLGPERLDLYLEEIQRNIHLHLVEEGKWEPNGCSPAVGFLKDPFTKGRNWGRNSAQEVVPGEIFSTRKYDTPDTPPNQFIKFALEVFRELCEDVISSLNHNNLSSTAVLEATAMRDSLDAFLVRPFFREIGRLSRLPLDNQTLQKREGYRQILQAWILLDAASKLDWPGREDAYDGTNRDVAVLYEYWLYFVIYTLLKEEPDFECLDIDNGVSSFIEKGKGGLSINLKQGKKSLSAFRWAVDGKESLRVHLYYNRTFVPKVDNILSSGSYSRHFRPDYSLVIFPERFAKKTSSEGCLSVENAEKKAEENGQIVYLHFDAKFRVDKLEKLFGKESTDSQNEDDLTDDLNDEHREAASTNVYKRGDLYKMHTYNDAIRRTVGSYVLYPGTELEKASFQRYHEILPGVGAFVLRPGEENGQVFGKDVLADFIRDILHVQQNRFSQLYRSNYWTHEIIKEAPGEYIESDLAPNNHNPPADTQTLLGFVRDVTSGEILLEKGLFYFHGIEEDGEPVEIDPRVFKADYLLPYSKKTGLGWYAEILESKMIKREQLIEELGEHSDILKSSCTHYYRLKLGCHIEMPEVNIQHLVARRPGKPVVKTWEEIFTQ